MDSFQSETLSSDSSETESTSSILPNSKTNEVRKRRIRTTEELLPSETVLVEGEEETCNIKQVNRPKRQNLSFLPKIDDLVESNMDNKTDAPSSSKPKANRIRTSFKTKAVLKLGKLKMKKQKTKHSWSKNERSNLNKTKKSIVDTNILAKVLSDAAEEFRSSTRMSLKLKRGKEGWKSVSGEEEDIKDTSRVVLKDLYVNLIPLEKTNLLNENQLDQLKCKKISPRTVPPLLLGSCNNFSLSLIETKSYLDKENVETNSTSKLSKKLSYNNKSLNQSFLLRQCRPCTVILERLSLDKIKKLSVVDMENNRHSRSVGKDSFNNNNLSRFNKNSLKIKFKTSKHLKRKTVSLGSQKTHSKKSSRRQTTNLSKIIGKSLGLADRSKTSHKNLEELCDKFVAFRPEECSSPLMHSVVSPLKLNRTVHRSTENPTKLTFVTKHLSCESECAKADSLNDSMSEIENLPISSDDEDVDGTYKVERRSSSGLILSLSPYLNSSKGNASEITHLNKSEKDRPISDSEDEKSLRTHDASDVKEELNGTFEIESVNSDKLLEFTKRVSSIKEATNKQQIYNRTMRRSYSVDSRLDVTYDKPSNSNSKRSSSFTLLNEQSINMPSVTKNKRRSTLTLDESVNNITLLKSTCNSSGTPQKLSVGQKRRHSCMSNDGYKREDFTKKVLNKNFRSRSLHERISNRKSQNQRDFSKVTVRKQNTPCLEKTKIKVFDEGESSSSSDLENTSPPWNTNSEFKDGSTYEAGESEFSKTGDTKFASTFEETSTELTSNKELDLSELSNEEDDVAYPSVFTSAECIDVTKPETTTKIRTVKFSTNLKENIETVLSKSCIKISSPKSMLKSKATPGTSNRRVTFSDMSVIIIDDSDGSIGSPVPTQFPPEDDSDDSVRELSRYNGKSTAGRTPAQVEKTLDSPKYNKRGTLGRTPMRQNITLKVSSLNKKANKNKKSPNEEKNVSTVKKAKPTYTPKRNKMPDFAKLHQKIFDKMLNLDEYSQKKKKRAQLLLSGNKPMQSNGSARKSIDKKAESATVGITNVIRSKKQLAFSNPKLPILQKAPAKPSKKPQLVSSTPKGKKNELAGYTRYGFKVTSDKSLNKKEQAMAVANKIRPPKLNKEENRTEIRGVRSNRRFELLMKMRQKNRE